MEWKYESTLDIEGQNYKVEILDTGGEEEFKNMMDFWISDAEGFLLVFAINDKESFSYINGMHERILKGKYGVKGPILLVGNKQDLVNERQVIYKEALAQADSWGIQYMETSAKTNFNCQEALEKLVLEIVKKNSNDSGCPCCNIM